MNLCYNIFKIGSEILKKKKLKLKKQVYYILAVLVFLVVGIILGINYYNDYKYRQTNEYYLTQHGYTLEQAHIIQEKLDSDMIQALLQQEKNDTIVSLMQEKYFMFKNLNDYLEYIKKEKEEDLQKVVALINTHANNKWYSKELKTDISLQEHMNVNKFYALSSEYKPENMKSISLEYSYGKEGDNLLIDYAYDKFIDLWNEAKDAGYHLMVTSSYRDYKSQKEIYDYRKSSQGERKADETAARPGHSEHQTGLVVDMTSKEAPIDEEFKESDAYKWLKDHAHEFGFIERYPEGKTYLTGYSPESWHWRYVGVDAATVVHDEGITYDEYYAFYIEK